MMNKLTRKLSLLFVVALVALAFGASSGTSAASAASCTATNFCVWYEPGFSSTKVPYNCVTGIVQAYGRSAINACESRAVKLLTGNPQSGWNVLACMNPSGERPDPGTFSGLLRLNSGEYC
jgi:hypothetical protein